MKYFCKSAVLSFCVMTIALLPARSADTDLGKNALAFLAESMKSKDADVRLTVVQTWGDIGNPAAVPLLSKALSDSDVYVRIAATQSLYRLKNRSGIPVLRSIIREDSAPKDGGNPIEEMLALARNKGRVRAIEVLSEIGGETAVSVLQDAVNDPSAAVKDASAAALARLGFSDYAQQFFDALKDKDETVRAAAADSVAKIANPDAWDALKKAAADPSPQVRRAVMRALSDGADPDAPAILSQALKDNDPSVKSLALSGLAQLKDSGTTDVLKTVLDDDRASDAQLKAQAGLARRGQRVDLSLASTTLGQRDADLKRLALDVLRADPAKEATSLLAKIMDSDLDPEMRIEAAAILVKRLQRPPAPKP